MNVPQLVTAALIRRKNKILLIKRARGPYEGKWALISGCGAFGETGDPAVAVKIEVKGDINCVFLPHFFTYNYEKFSVPSISLFFHGDIKGKPKPDPKYVSEWKWCTFSESLKLISAFEHKKILKKFIAGILVNQSSHHS